MRFSSKLFLALAILFWGISYTPFGNQKLYDIPKPLGAVFFGLFLITWILPRQDMQQFEQDQALRNQCISEERKIRKRQRGSRGRWRPHLHKQPV